jgi:hypothetical protein
MPSLSMLRLPGGVFFFFLPLKSPPSRREQVSPICTPARIQKSTDNEKTCVAQMAHYTVGSATREIIALKGLETSAKRGNMAIGLNVSFVEAAL